MRFRQFQVYDAESAAYPGQGFPAPNKFKAVLALGDDGQFYQGVLSPERPLTFSRVSVASEPQPEDHESAAG
jgi:hypothetical protein